MAKHEAQWHTRRGERVWTRRHKNGRIDMAQEQLTWNRQSQRRQQRQGNQARRTKDQTNELDLIIPDTEHDPQIQRWRLDGSTMLVDSAVQPAEPNQRYPLTTRTKCSVVCTLFRQTDRIICHTGKNTCLGKFCALPLVPRSRALGRLVAYGAQHRLTEGIRKSRAPIQVARPWHPVQYISAQSSFALLSTEHSRTIKTCKPPTNQPTVVSPASDHYGRSVTQKNWRSTNLHNTQTKTQRLAFGWW